MRLPERHRGALREPLGRLVPDAEVTRESVMGGAPAGAALVTVGDATAERAAALGLEPLLQVVDGRTRRGGCAVPRPPPGAAVVECENPAGGISAGCEAAVREALGAGSPVQLLVRGEEDLLALPACLHAPDGAVVAYGQPGEGLVVVRVDAGARARAGRLLGLMERGDDEKAAA